MTKSFGATRALDGVSLRPGRRERSTPLIGENGAGKSTLMKILSGAYRPDSGTMTLAGSPYAPQGPARGAAAGRGDDLPGADAGAAPDGRGQCHARPGARRRRA